MVRAPARVNIIGEHCDYNDGLVLPMATSLFTWVAVSPANGRGISAFSRQADDSVQIDLADPKLQGGQHWGDYVTAVVLGLLGAGHQLRDVSLYIDSEIPIGGGLSSSASLELAVATALLEASGQESEARTIARICQQAEVSHVGVNCGIMDQYAIALSRRGSAMLLDCRYDEIEWVPVADTMCFIVADSGVSHKLSDGGLNTRREECEQAVAVIGESVRGVTALRDVSMDVLRESQSQLGGRLYRRARHVVSEIDRVKKSAAALAAGDATSLGQLMNESHRSLCEDFEVNCPETDVLTDLFRDTDGVIGARQMGAGFGGCVLALVEPAQAQSISKAVSAQWQSHVGRPLWLHEAQPMDAVGVAQ